MILLVANIINIFATTLQNVLVLASFTGKLIVSVVSWISSMIYNTLNSLFLFFQIVYEDNITIFTEEIPDAGNGVIDAILDQVNHVKTGVTHFYYIVNLKIYAAITNLSWMAQTVFIMCAEVLSIIKGTIIFIGDTMWLIITFIPVHLPVIIRALVKYISDEIINAVICSYMSLLKVTNYLTEVPLQSFMGLTSAIVIVRLFVHFRETILNHMTLWYWLMIRNILYLYYLVLNYFSNSEVAVIPRIVSGEDVNAREVNFSASDEDDSVNAADSLCVICQERQKCVLTLPCRHVCLCADCCRRLYGYQRTCPICRTFIYHSVTVYL